MQRELPTGTVTFLFTDIEGSTRLLNELGTEPYDEALAEHRRLRDGSKLRTRLGEDVYAAAYAEGRALALEDALALALRPD